VPGEVLHLHLFTRVLQITTFPRSPAESNYQGSKKWKAKGSEDHMKGWKWILATAALMIGITGGAFAQEQRWGDRRDTDGAFAQRYESNRNYPHFRRRFSISRNNGVVIKGLAYGRSGCAQSVS